MARGRPRREGAERDDKGRIKSATYEAADARAAARAARKAHAAAERKRLNEDAAKIARWERMREFLLQIAADPRLESPVGRMLVLGVPVRISPAQYEAALRFEKILVDYDRAVLARRRSVQAQAISAARGRALNNEIPQDAIDRFTDAFEECESICRPSKGY